MTDQETLLKARKALASRYRQVYHINAIMSGDWDNGTLIKAEIEKQRKTK